MDDFVYRKDLISREDLTQLQIRSDRPALVRLGGHLAAIVFLGVLVGALDGSVLLLPVWVAYGITLAFLFSPLHECIHNTAFESRDLNKVVAAVAGFLLLLPANYFRHFHFEHHRYTNEPQRDPELQLEKPSDFAGYLRNIVGIQSYWIPQIRSIANHARGTVEDTFIPQSKHQSIVTEARVHVAIYASIVAVSVISFNGFFLTYWIIPMLFGMVALRLFLLAEHTGCEYSDNMLKNTRTTLTTPFVTWLSWNMPYHTEHHLFPSVPFHRLPALHSLLQFQLGVVCNGYSQFHRQLTRTF